MGSNGDDTLAGSLAVAQTVQRWTFIVVIVSSREARCFWLVLTTKLDANKFISTSSLKWYPPFLMIVLGSLTHISVQKQQTLPVDLTQIESYFEVMISNLYLWWEMLSNVYNMSMFEVVCKRLYFSRQSVKLKVKILSHFTCRANWDSESGFKTTRLDATNQWLSQNWQTNFH